MAVVGSLLATRYQDRMTGALSGRPLPATVKNSFGGALAAARAGGTTGPPLVHLAKTAFISGRACSPAPWSPSPAAWSP